MIVLQNYVTVFLKKFCEKALKMVSVFQDIIDDDSDLEDICITPSSKVNQRFVCLFGPCYHNCLISNW